MAKMPLSELKAMLASEHADALAAVAASKLSSERADAMDYYLGNMDKDLPAADGRSHAVSTDVSDTIEGLMPNLMEIFAGGDEVVKFEPVGPEDVKAAEQETDYVNHVFMQANPGFLVLYSFIKDALLSKVGVVKVWWEQKTLEERETYYDLPDDAYALLRADPDITIIAHSVRPLASPAGDEAGEPAEQDSPGEPAPPMLHDVECRRSKDAANVKIEPVPPEEFGISRNARSIRDCDYAFHKVLITRAKLIAQGFDAEQVKALTPYVAITNTEEIQRDTVNEYQTAGDEANQAAQRVEVTEHYVRMDYEGDGDACLYQVTTGGSQGDILAKDGKPDIQRIDVIPFAAMTPVIVTHRFFGRSIADLVMDIQRIKTALIRAMLDNAYLANNPRVEVAEQMISDNTLDDLLVSRPGGIVRTKQPGGLNWQAVPSIAAQTFPVLEYMDAARELRTGVTRQGQGIDANALQNQSATAVNQVFTAAQSRIKLIARVFAETGIRDLFTLVHATIRKHGQQAQTVRLRNQWVTVDPREWKSRYDMTVKVGLGTGSKQEQLGTLNMIIGAQKEAIALGMVSKKNLHNSASELVKLSGRRNPDDFFIDPSQPANPQDQAAAPIPPPPNPEMVKAQADQQATQGQLQVTAAKAQADQQHVQTQAAADLAIEQQKFEHAKELSAREDARKQAAHEMDMHARRIDLVKNLTSIGQTGPDGQQKPVDLDGMISRLAPMLHPPAPLARGHRVVRDALGRISHTEPIG